MPYALATLNCNSKATPVIEVGGRFHALGEIASDLLQPAPSRGLMNLFGDWDASDRRLGQLAEELVGSARGLVEPTPCQDQFLAPLLVPSKLLLGGANYYEHMRVEANIPDFQKETAMPVFFMKPASTSIVGSGRSVRYPVQTKELDWEIELAVVVGRRLRRASEREAGSAIAGYAVGIDLSARDWQFNQKHPWKFDLFTGKAFDDACPMGPKFVPARFVDVRNLRLSLWVNGVLKQNAHTSDMIWPPAEQLAILSQHTTLKPGDILLTGTPAGVGMPRKEFLHIGDRIDAEITGLGRLSIEIVPDADRPPITFES